MNETASNSETKTFTKTIWASRKELFLAKLRKLNRILARNGRDPISVKFENFRPVHVEFTRHVKGDSFRNDSTETQLVEMCDAVCSGFIRVGRSDASYDFLGSVVFQDGVKQVFCKDEAYASFFTDGFRNGYCDHCRSSRSNRKAYYLFRNEASGEVLQIGSTCAREFFGIDSTAFLDACGKTFLVDYDGSDDDLASFSKGSIAVDFNTVSRFLDYATNGFLKWNKAGYDSNELLDWERPTTSVVRKLVNADPFDIKPEMTLGPNCGLVSYDDVLAFWKAKYENEGSSFAYNCLNAIKAGYAVDISLGTFCYAIFAAYNAKVRAIRDAEAASQTYVPCAFPEGSRSTVSGRITALRDFTSEIPGTESFRNNYRGELVDKRIVDFTDDNGTLYHFSTSAKSFFDLDVGDRISMRCTIGATKVYRGVPYVRVSRPVATVIEKASAA